MILSCAITYMCSVPVPLCFTEEDIDLFMAAINPHVDTAIIYINFPF